MLEEKIISAINDNQVQNAFVMIYFYDQVIIGKYENNELYIPVNYQDDLWSEIHIFNPDLELRCTREHPDFVKIESNRDYFDENMYIIGNQSEIVDNKYTIITQYGRKVIVPFPIDIKNAKHQLRLVVHHLFSEKGNYIDGYRLVDLKEIVEKEEKDNG